MPASADAPTHDLLVLGAGSGGYACALRAAQLGMSVALVERDLVGGTCLHRGCIPTKALLHAAEVADAARDGHRFGVRTVLEAVDMPAVTAYKDSVVSRLHRGLEGLVTQRGVEVVRGDGRLVDAGTVAVGGRTLSAPSVVLATGSVARTLPGVPLGRRVVTSDGALALDEVPGRVVVLGGGVIGVEFASIFRSFGADVTVLEALPRLLPGEDAAVSAQLQRAYRRRGITVRTGARVAGVVEDEHGVRVDVDGGTTLEADLLLVAVGRGPASAGLGFGEAGVSLDEGGFVVTDDRCRTTLEGVRAVGDLVRGVQLAHRGFAHGIFVAEDLAGLDPAPVDESVIPRVTYSDPEVASVGLTEEQARERFGEVATAQYGLGGNGRSLILGTSGFVKLVRRVDGPVVGVHMVGARMSEQAGEAQLVVGWEAFPEDVAPFLHAHPTQNEALGEAQLALAGKPLHSHD
ncbi:MAG TPA: dihydrolipoyl dehydrogenase [Dermatophilaceae bacterium]|nr:dihydrolipoyl dehydrogenase [Dermatophilaceae bacterium]